MSAMIHTKPVNNELRCYTIVNQYLNGIHAGIQSAHAIAKMFSEYDSSFYNDSVVELLNIWSNKHETIIVLDGGYQSNLSAIHKLFSNRATGMFPYSRFNESTEALNGALTALAIVLPDYIYKACDSNYCGWCYEGDNGFYYLTPDETEIAKVVTKLKLKI